LNYAVSRVGLPEVLDQRQIGFAPVNLGVSIHLKTWFSELESRPATSSAPQARSSADHQQSH
jgi:hypothetical protein